MKTTIKLILALSLFGSIALADGNQGTGGSPMAQPSPTTTDSITVTVVLDVVKLYLGF
jgi:hypothetical protein